jgi:hypothetical protein
MQMMLSLETLVSFKSWTSSKRYVFVIEFKIVCFTNIPVPNLAVALCDD